MAGSDPKSDQMGKVIGGAAGGVAGSDPKPQLAYTDLYSPDLKLVLGREYKKREGQTQLIKFDRVYPIKK